MFQTQDVAVDANSAPFRQSIHERRVSLSDSVTAPPRLALGNATGNGSDEWLLSTADFVLPDGGELWFYIVVYKHLVPTLFGVVALVGLIGNALVIYVVTSRADMRRNAVNLLLLNLAAR